MCAVGTWRPAIAAGNCAAVCPVGGTHRRRWDEYRWIMLHQLSTIGKPFYEQFLSRVKLKVNLLNTQATLQVCFERQAFFSGKVAVFDPASDRFVQEFVGHTDCVHSMKLIWPCQLRHQEACHTDARIDASWTDIPTVAKMKRTPCDPKECLVQKWLRALGQIFHAFCLSIYASIDISCFKAEHCPKTSQTSPRCHAKMCSQALLTLMCVCVFVCWCVCVCVCVSQFMGLMPFLNQCFLRYRWNIQQAHIFWYFLHSPWDTSTAHQGRIAWGSALGWLVPQQHRRVAWRGTTDGAMLLAQPKRHFFNSETGHAVTNLKHDKTETFSNWKERERERVITVIFI